MSYTAAVLTESSRAILLFHFSRLIPADYERIAHHMTLHMGDPVESDNLGSMVKLTVNAFAINNKVAAVRISKGGEISSNSVPHITLAVNRGGGGKPVDSNFLINWKNLSECRVGMSFLTLEAKIEKCG